MVFNSYLFILFFLPLAVCGYFILNQYFYGKNGQAGLLWLLGLSLGFYAWDLPIFLALFGTGIVINYLIGKLFYRLKQKKEDTGKWQKLLLSIGVLLNLAPLAYFKYGDFFVDSIEDFFHAEWNVEVALPLGISFYTFMQIAYLVDCYREKKGFDYSFAEYAAYVAFFPKITMGPIALHSEMIPQFRDPAKKKVNYYNLSCGLYSFSQGLAKKVLLADSLAKIVNAGYYDVYELNSMTAVVVALSYTLQLYFDFSGYCDMAMGVSRMLNIELPLNFHSPYKAKSISEFWERWHMTLTRFFTRYVYIPMGGSKKGRVRTYINTIIVFLLSGLWHGAEWNFVFWGLLHGSFMVLEKIIKDFGFSFKNLPKTGRKILDGVKWLYTFLVINFTWIFFRAVDMERAMEYVRRLFSGGRNCQEVIINVFDKIIEIRILKRFGLDSIVEAFPDLFLWSVLLLMVACVVFLKNTQEKVKEEKYQWLRSIVTVVLLVWCVVSLSEVSEFLYFNF